MASFSHGDHAALYGYFAVGIFSAMLMEYEVHFYSSGAIEEKWTPKDLGENFMVAALGSVLGSLLTVGLLALGALVFLPRGIFPDLLSTAVLAGAFPFGAKALVLALLGTSHASPPRPSRPCCRAPTIFASSSISNGARTSLPGRFTSAIYCIAGGIVGAIVAAVPGLIDYFSIEEKEMSRIATRHMIANLIAVAIFALNLWLRFRLEEDTKIPFLLSLVGVALIGLGGWLGGEMVYVKGMAVQAVEAVVKKGARRG